MCILFVLLFVLSVSTILDSENSFHSSGINVYTSVLIFRYVAIHQLGALQWKPHHVLLGRGFLQQVISLSL